MLGIKAAKFFIFFGALTYSLIAIEQATTFRKKGSAEKLLNALQTYREDIENKTAIKILENYISKQPDNAILKNKLETLQNRPITYTYNITRITSLLETVLEAMIDGPKQKKVTQPLRAKEIAEHTYQFTIQIKEGSDVHDYIIDVDSKRRQQDEEYFYIIKKIFHKTFQTDEFENIFIDIKLPSGDIFSKKYRQYKSSQWTLLSRLFNFYTRHIRCEKMLLIHQPDSSYMDNKSIQMQNKDYVWDNQNKYTQIILNSFITHIKAFVTPTFNTEYDTKLIPLKEALEVLANKKLSNVLKDIYAGYKENYLGMISSYIIAFKFNNCSYVYTIHTGKRAPREALRNPNARTIKTIIQMKKQTNALITISIDKKDTDDNFYSQQYIQLDKNYRWSTMTNLLSRYVRKKEKLFILQADGTYKENPNKSGAGWMWYRFRNSLGF